MRKARQELLRLIVMALQSGGIQGGEQRKFAVEMGEREDFFVHHVINYYEHVSLDRLADLYDVAATRVGWLTLAEILRQYHDDVRNGRYLPVDLEREARRYVDRVDGIAPYDQVLAAVWRAWPPRPRPTYSTDPDESVGEQIEQAGMFDGIYPPTVAWYEALIEALRHNTSLDEKNRQRLIQQHLDAIAKLKAGKQ